MKLNPKEVKKMNKNKLMSMFMLSLLVFSVAMVSAGNGVQSKFESNSQYSVENLNTYQNKFQNKYQYNFTGEHIYKAEGEKVMLQVREQRKFLFWDIETVDEYELNENGEVIAAKYNFWSRLMNRNKIQVE